MKRAMGHKGGDFGNNSTTSNREPNQVASFGGRGGVG